MTNEINKIKYLVDNGVECFSVNDGYKIIKDKIGQYLVKFTPNGYCFGLTNQAGDHLNVEEVYYYEDGGRVYIN